MLRQQHEIRTLATELATARHDEERERWERQAEEQSAATAKMERALAAALEAKADAEMEASYARDELDGLKSELSRSGMASPDGGGLVGPIETTPVANRAAARSRSPPRGDWLRKDDSKPDKRASGLPWLQVPQTHASVPGPPRVLVRRRVASAARRAPIPTVAADLDRVTRDERPASQPKASRRRKKKARRRPRSALHARPASAGPASTPGGERGAEGGLPARALYHLDVYAGQRSRP